jgi:hypothetical protein
LIASVVETESKGWGHDLGDQSDRGSRRGP